MSSLVIHRSALDESSRRRLQMLMPNVAAACPDYCHAFQLEIDACRQSIAAASASMLEIATRMGSRKYPPKPRNPDRWCPPYPHGITGYPAGCGSSPHCGDSIAVQHAAFHHPLGVFPRSLAYFFREASWAVFLPPRSGSIAELINRRRLERASGRSRPRCAAPSSGPHVK